MQGCQGFALTCTLELCRRLRVAEELLWHGFHRLWALINEQQGMGISIYIMDNNRETLFVLSILM
jgi:hypothetical protein